MISKILDNLYLSEFSSIEEEKGQLICVLEQLPKNEPKDALWIPILRTNAKKIPIKNGCEYTWWEEIIEAIPSQLDLVANTISRISNLNIPVIVHCMAGQERSPLAVMWYLWRYGYCDTLGEAFNFVKEKHTIALNRLYWIPNYSKGVLE